MVGIEQNPTFINRIANSEGVKEFLRVDGGSMDFTPITEAPITQTGVVVLSNGEDAVGLFEITCDGVWQGHIAFAESCRGKRAIETGREMLDWMFEHNAEVIWGAVPRWNKPTIWFARAIGMRPTGNGDEDTEILEIKRVH